jgi:excisionase family DNA binding protein
MPRRAASARRIKKHLNYTVEEAAETTGYHPHTIRRWIETKALQALTERRPYLIPGRFFHAFLSAAKPGKRRLMPGECYCVKCRQPRRPAFGEADYRPVSALTGSLQGLCPECGTLMFRRVGLAKLGSVTGDLHVTIQDAERHLERRDAAIANVNFGNT